MTRLRPREAARSWRGGALTAVPAAVLVAVLVVVPVVVAAVVAAPATPAVAAPAIHAVAASALAVPTVTGNGEEVEVPEDAGEADEFAVRPSVLTDPAAALGPTLTPDAAARPQPHPAWSPSGALSGPRTSAVPHAVPYAFPYAATPAGCGGYRTRGWVAAENARPGTGWFSATAPARTAAYADRVSAQCGEAVRLFVSTPAPTYRVVAFRLGWYGGKQARAIWSSAVLNGAVQAAAVVGPAPERTVTAPWSPSLTTTIDGTWPPGDYLFAVLPSTGGVTYVPLTVRDDGARADLAVVNAVTTWQAYNSWGGYSLYAGPGDVVATRSRVVSFDRPYAPQPGTSFGDGQFIALELPFVRWAERRGLHVTYLTDVDVDQRPPLLQRHRALVFLSHAEYWSAGARRAVEAARDKGVNLLFLGANTAYWRARYAPSPSAAGIPADRAGVTLDASRRLVAQYRAGPNDPAGDPHADNPGLVTARWRDAPVSRPEARLVGVQYTCLRQVADGVVVAPTSWVFAGMNLRAGARIRGLVQGENDRVFTDLAPAGLQVLGHTRFGCKAHGGEASGWNLTYYGVPSGAGVLAVGTMGWVCALDASCPATPGDRTTAALVDRITANVVTAFAAGPAAKRYPPVANLRAICAPRGACVGATPTATGGRPVP